MQAVLQDPGARRPAEGPSPWLHSRGFDLSLIVGVLAIALALGAIASASPVLFAAVLVADFWLLAYPHVASTFTRIACDRQSFRRYWFLLFGLPPLVLAATAGLTWKGGVIALNTLYFTWQSWHYSRQSYGIARAYSRRAGDPKGRDRLSDLVIYAFPIWGLVYRSSQGNHEFYRMPLYCPQAPSALATTLGIIAFSALFFWLLRAHRARARTPGRGTGHTLFILSHVLITLTSYVLIDDITRGWLFINIWHNAQYLLFVWAANARRFRGGIQEERAFISRLSQPKNVLFYAIFVLGLGALIYTGLDAALGRSAWEVLPLVLVVHMAVNFHHYLVDSVIWRSPRSGSKSNSVQLPATGPHSRRSMTRSPVNRL
ncbi:MAG TPA: hypothetical protein ENJ18_02230 [Nannocystis exedens]|nr:hypothetical protein [Nannocystis exedens]